MIDTRKYIDLKELRGVSEKLEKLLGQYETSGEKFRYILEISKKTKKKCNIENIGSCIGFLGVIAPAIMLCYEKIQP